MKIFSQLFLTNILRPPLNRLIVLLYLILSLPNALAETKIIGDAIEQKENYIAIDKIHFSIALGAGVKTNPLVGGDNIPLFIVPSLKYYGENFYFDNGDLGYSFFQNEQLTLSAVSRINSENAYFSRWHPKNIFIFSSASGVNVDSEQIPDAEPSEIPERIDVKNIHARRWAIDTGLQLNWFLSSRSQVKIQVLHDINGVYDGFNGRVEYFRQFSPIKSTPFTAQITIGFDWFSKSMVNYYYGINNKDNVDSALYYQSGSALNPYIKLHAGYPLSKQWTLFSAISYKALAASIKDSPIVEASNNITGFIGANYVF